METWRFKAKAITKYNPENYNAEGVYMQSDEWTSRSDIGKKIDSTTNTLLTKERYLEVEDGYINAVRVFMRAVGAEKIKVIELYKISDEDDFDKWKDNELFSFYSELEEKDYDVSEIDVVIRLALREYIQVALQLITPKMDSAVYFGDDYYMYFVSDTVDFNKLQINLKVYQVYING